MLKGFRTQGAPGFLFECCPETDLSSALAIVVDGPPSTKWGWRLIGLHEGLSLSPMEVLELSSAEVLTVLSVLAREADHHGGHEYYRRRLVDAIRKEYLC